MPLIQNTYGKGRVRVMRVHRGERHEVRELTIMTLLDGDFAAAYTEGDNRTVVATDTIKNIAYIVARENMTAGTEEYGGLLAARFLQRYPQVERVRVSLRETRWARASFGGDAHPHSFVLDSNGQPTAEVSATRDGATVVSGIAGYTFMKTTESGWVDYVMDEYTTLPPTRDRIAATAMDASWTWVRPPAWTTAPRTRASWARCWRCSPPPTATACRTACTGWARRRSPRCPSWPANDPHGVPEQALPAGEAGWSKFAVRAVVGQFMVFTPTDEPHGRKLQIECLVMLPSMESIYMLGKMQLPNFQRKC